MSASDWSHSAWLNRKIEWGSLASGDRMARVYLDTSAYNCPFDDQTQPKIFLETQAVVIILQMVEVRAVELIGSSVLKYENSRNPYPIK